MYIFLMYLNKNQFRSSAAIGAWEMKPSAHLGDSDNPTNQTTDPPTDQPTDQPTDRPTDGQKKVMHKVISFQKLNIKSKIIKALDKQI